MLRLSTSRQIHGAVPILHMAAHTRWEPQSMTKGLQHPVSRHSGLVNEDASKLYRTTLTAAYHAQAIVGHRVSHSGRACMHLNVVL